MWTFPAQGGFGKPRWRRRGASWSVGKLRILVGDDHTLVRQGFRKILEERREWEVVAEASDGRDAVRQAAAAKPDIAILDIGMPLLNGIEATRQIVRRLPAHGAAPEAADGVRRHPDHRS